MTRFVATTWALAAAVAAYVAAGLIAGFANSAALLQSAGGW